MGTRMARPLNSLSLYFSLCIIANKQRRKKIIILECNKYFEGNKHEGMKRVVEMGGWGDVSVLGRGEDGSS